MARPRSFDPVEVLDAAIAEFRIRGFTGTSTEQLCAATHLRRSSLYNTFTSKDELFVQALQRYVDTMYQQQEVICADSALSGGEQLWCIIELALKEEECAYVQGRAAGCMVVHTLMSPDVRAKDSRVQRILHRDYERRRLLLIDTARQGQRDGSVNDSLTPQDVALSVIAVISGIRIAAQAGSEPEELRRIARVTMATILSFQEGV